MSDRDSGYPEAKKDSLVAVVFDDHRRLSTGIILRNALLSLIADLTLIPIFLVAKFGCLPSVNNNAISAVLRMNNEHYGILIFVGLRSFLLVQKF